MKILFIVLLFGVAFFALYEQSKPEPNKFLMIGAIVLFMLGLMRLMSKVPGKNEKNDNDV